VIFERRNEVMIFLRNRLETGFDVQILARMDICFVSGGIRLRFFSGLQCRSGTYDQNSGHEQISKMILGRKEIA